MKLLVYWYYMRASTYSKWNLFYNSIILYFFSCNLHMETNREKALIKLQRLKKVQIWAFRSLVHQLKQNFQNNKVVTGETPFFVISPFCSHRSICLNIGTWYCSFVWKWCALNLISFNWEMVLQFFEKIFGF